MPLRAVLAAFHGLLGIAAFFAGNAGFVSATSAGDRNSYGVLMALGLFMIATGAGLHFRRRWIVVLGAVPVAMVALLFSAILLIGGWVWGPQNANSVYLMSFCSFLLAIVELVAVFVRLRLNRHRTAPP
jgi:hypothetical protein